MVYYWLGLLLTGIISTTSQAPIPPRIDGFTLGNGKPTAQVHVDVFIDLLCPDCKAAYPVLQKLLEHYSPEVLQIRAHMFPLPYHRNAYSAAQATFTLVHALGKDAFTPWMEGVFKVQDKFWNKQTEELGQKAVTQMYEQLAWKIFPNLSKKDWKKGMSGHGGTAMDSKTRVSWKYACSRGVSGTPFFLVNDVACEADSSWTLNQWLDLIDPLLEEDHEHTDEKENYSKQKNEEDPKLQQHTDKIDKSESKVTTSNLDEIVNFSDDLDCVSHGYHSTCTFLKSRLMCCEKDEQCDPQLGCVASPSPK